MIETESDSDVIEVRPDERFDEGIVAKFLRDKLPGADQPLTVRQFGGGAANLTYLLDYGTHQYVLSSPREAVIYCSSATGIEGKRFVKQPVRAKGLAILAGDYAVEIIKPDAGLLENRRIELNGSSIEIGLPAFTDDIAVHLTRRTD